MNGRFYSFMSNMTITKAIDFHSSVEQFLIIVKIIRSVLDDESIRTLKVWIIPMAPVISSRF